MINSGQGTVTHLVKSRKTTVSGQISSQDIDKGHDIKQTHTESDNATDQAPNKLSKRADIVIKRADKGSCIVIEDRIE